MTMRKITGVLGTQLVSYWPGFLLLFLNWIRALRTVEVRVPNCGHVHTGVLWKCVPNCTHIHKDPCGGACPTAPCAPGILWRCVCVPKGSHVYTGILGLLTEGPLQPCWV